MKTCELDALTVRATTQLLSRLELLAVRTLADVPSLTTGSLNDHPAGRHLVEVLVAQGWTQMAAIRAANRLSELARHVRDTWGGHLQAYLRRHGEQMIEELVTTVPIEGLSDARRRLVFGYWLQNVLAMPVAVRTGELDAFCARAGVTFEAMVGAADAIDLNVGLLDDLARATAPR